MTEWIVTSSVLVLVVVALRYLLRGKISLRLQYGLWALVLLRLLVPFTVFQSPISVMNAVEEINTLQLSADAYTYSPAIEDIEFVPDADNDPTDTITTGSIVGYYPEDSDRQFPTVIVPNATAHEYEVIEKAIEVKDVLVPIWLTGVGVMLAVFLLSNLHYGGVLRRDRRELHIPGSIVPVYFSTKIETPCLYGFFHPAIYVTEECATDDTMLRHVLAHESTHYRHGDNIWAVLRCLSLALHWYNPLVWLAAFLSRRDAELACDEGAIKRLGESERMDYGRTLIGLTCQDIAAKGLVLTATTMTGSKKSIRERIMLIAKKPRMALYTLVAVLLIAAIAVGCTFSGAESGFTDRDAKKEAKPYALGCANANYVELLNKPEILRYEGEGGKDEYIRVSYPLKNDERHIVVFLNMRDENGNCLDEPYSAEVILSNSGLPIIGDIELVDSVSMWSEGKANPEIPSEREAELLDYLTQLEYGELWPPQLAGQMPSDTYGFTVYYTDGSSMSFGLNSISLPGDIYYQIQRPGEPDWLSEIIIGDGMILDSPGFAIENADGIAAISGSIIEHAHNIVQRNIDYYNSLGYDIQEARLSSLSLVSSAILDDEGTGVEMYLVEYRLRPADPDSVAVAGGMRMEDGWITEWGSTGQPCLMIVTRDGVFTGLSRTTNTLTIAEEYATEAMLAKYGDANTAACMEIFSDLLEQETLTVNVRTEQKRLTPYMHLSHSKEWTENGWLMADGIELTAEYIESHSIEIPSITYSPRLTIEVSTNLLSSIDVYDQSFQPIHVNGEYGYEGLTALRWLTPGTYYCVFGVYGPQGEYIESEGEYEESAYQCIFRLKVMEDRFNAKSFESYTGWDIESIFISSGGSLAQTVDQANIDEIERILSTAKDMGFVGACGYGDAIYLMGEGGTIAICLAGDDCSNFFSDGKCWEISDADMEILRHIAAYPNKIGSSFYFTGDNEALVELYAREIYAKELLSVPSGDNYAITDYRLVDCGLFAVRVDGGAVVGSMTYAVSPENSNQSYWWAGNTGLGEGEYEGMLTMGRQFTLTDLGGGYWACTGMGTGGAGGWGYVYMENAERANEDILLYLSYGDSCAENILMTLPLANWADIPEDIFFKIMDIVEDACVGEGRLYGPEDWRTWPSVYPDDQLYRNLYCMKAALNTDGAYAVRMQYVLNKQYHHDPELFEECLQMFSPEEQDILRELADDEFI